MHPQLPLGLHSVLSRQKGQQMVNTGNLPLHARIKSGMRKQSTNDESSLDKKESKTPKALGTQRNTTHHVDSDFTSHSSTAEKHAAHQR